MKIQTIEMDPDKVYSISVEIGDMPWDEAIKLLDALKSAYGIQGIKGVYNVTRHSVPAIIINPCHM